MRQSAAPVRPVRRWVHPHLLAAEAIVLFGVWYLWQALALHEGPGYAAVGPRVFPALVGTGVLLSGAALVLDQLRQPAELVPPAVEPADWPTLGLTALAFALYLASLLPLGFVPATTLFVPLCARVLGSRALLRDLLSGAGLSLTTSALFTRLLGLELPRGPLALFG